MADRRYLSGAMFYKRRSKCGGMDASPMARMKELEGGNRRLKKMFAEERRTGEIVAEVLARSGGAMVAATFRVL